MPHTLAPWAKTDGYGCDSHHLAHHCADVAACFEAITSLPVIRSRMEKAAGGALAPSSMARLAVLTFLHDAGKLHPGFQAKGWPESSWHGRRRGHVMEGAAIFFGDDLAAIARSLCIMELAEWGMDQITGLLSAALAHHGRPIEDNLTAAKQWEAVKTSDFIYDPIPASAEIGTMLRRWFPEAFLTRVESLPSRPHFAHYFPLGCACRLARFRPPSSFRLSEFLIPITLEGTEQSRHAVSAIGLNTRSADGA